MALWINFLCFTSIIGHALQNLTTSMSQEEAVRAMHIVSLFLLSSKIRGRGIDVELLFAVLLSSAHNAPVSRTLSSVNVSSLLTARNENRFVLLFFFVSRVSLYSSLTSSSTRLRELILALSSRIAESNQPWYMSFVDRSAFTLWANFADCRYRINYLSYLWLKSLRSYSCLGCLPYFISYSYFYAPRHPIPLKSRNFGLSRTAACLLVVHQTRRDSKRVLFICLPNALAR